MASGGRAHRPSCFAEDLLADGIARAPLHHFVVWTGDAGVGRQGSVRARVFSCLDEARTLISLRDLLQRAARLDDHSGLHPDAVRSAIRQHQSAQPTVLLLLERRASGEFVAVTDIPFAGQAQRRVRAGDVIVDARGQCLL